MARFRKYYKVQRQRASRLCQRSSAPGVTRRPIRTGLGSSRAKAASTARSASPASAEGAAAVAPRPLGAAPATRRPSTPTNAPAALSSRSGGRTSGRAPVWPQASDTATTSTAAAEKVAGQPPMPCIGPLRGFTAPGHFHVPALSPWSLRSCSRAQAQQSGSGTHTEHRSDNTRKYPST